jgi:dihydroceramidase
MGAYLLGIVVWFCDLRFCAQLGTWLPRHGIPNPQLHAWWHVLVACGFYALLLFIARVAPASAPELIAAAP